MLVLVVRWGEPALFDCNSARTSKINSPDATGGGLLNTRAKGGKDACKVVGLVEALLNDAPLKRWPFPTKLSAS